MIILTSYWKINDVEAVIFDKDGTLIDSHTYWGNIIKLRANKLIEENNAILTKKIFPKLCLAMGYDINSRKLIPEGPIALVSRKEVIKAVAEFLIPYCPLSNSAIEEIFNEVDILHQHSYIRYVELLPGVAKLFSSLKALDIPIGLITSDSTISAIYAMRHCGIAEFFQFIHGRESSSKPKESGVPCKEMIEVMKVNPKKTIIIGDAPMDALMAKNAGAYGSILVKTGQVVETSLLEYTPFVIDTLCDLEVI